MLTGAKAAVQGTPGTGITNTRGRARGCFVVWERLHSCMCLHASCQDLYGTVWCLLMSGLFGVYMHYVMVFGHQHAWLYSYDMTCRYCMT